MIIIYYVWSLVVDIFLFLRGLVYKVMGIPICRVDILAWLFIAGYTVVAIWWPPLTGQSRWTVVSGAISGAGFLIVGATFRLLFNRNHVFRKGWSHRLIDEGKNPLGTHEDDTSVEVVAGSGESSTMCVAVTQSSLLLPLKNDRGRGLELAFDDVCAELGLLYRYCRIRPALRLSCKALGRTPVYIFKAPPAVLFGIFALITTRQQKRPSLATGNRVLISVLLAAGVVITFTFGLWRFATITASTPSYPVGMIASPQSALYELPALESKLISHLEVGEPVIIIQDTGNWYYIVKSSREAGYVMKGAVKVQK